MLCKTMIATALLVASAGAMADDDFVYGRVVTVEPNFVLSFGSGRHQDGFLVLYEVGGRHYWIHHDDHPGHTIWVPRPAGHYAHPRRHHYHDHHGDRDDRRHSLHHQGHDRHRD